MNVDIRLPTRGVEIRVEYSLMDLHEGLNCEIAVLHLRIGDATLVINFETWGEMDKFCLEHNFNYVDKRGVK